MPGSRIPPSLRAALGAAALLSTAAALSAAALASPDHQPALTAPLWSLITLVIVTTTGALVVGCVLLHYETLRLLSLALVRMHAKRRRRIVFLVLSLVTLATVEIWLFGIGYYLLLGDPAFGALHGPGTEPDKLLDCVYFSAVIYSTLGLGDLIPSGSIRFLVGTQALVGFTLLSWSAAFTFLEMERFWRDSTERRHRAAYGPHPDSDSGR
jgi:hypothetical protein